MVENQERDKYENVFGRIMDGPGKWVWSNAYQELLWQRVLGVPWLDLR